MNMTKQTFAIDASWPAILQTLSIEPQDLLRHAQLPWDLFSQQPMSLSVNDYLRFWSSLETLHQELHFPINLVNSVSPEVFSPPIFASFCSSDLNRALKRLVAYKPLIGPLELELEQTEQYTSIELAGIAVDRKLPTSFIMTELLFFVQLARLGTREAIIPYQITVNHLPSDKSPYQDFFGIPLTQGPTNRVVFRAQDAAKPFLTANKAMSAIFEKELALQVSMLEQNSSFSERVSACLLEMISSGETSMSEVAQRLAMTERTLQRRLKAENTNFKTELSQLREKLAKHYLTKTPYSIVEIAFLLGYQDSNSFIRAFKSWTGQTPDSLRH
ncbi:AraC family transcriptional regulator [Kangiella sp. TOML190]|uniref:AraC family transcriptional regulator n=1 Tax=Kangiella sp. TOML190 TaxID=2931351 RepID=UPI00203AC68A|nr:AraC family transcriptional regulator [Kangiella sp. TOML190]